MNKKGVFRTQVEEFVIFAKLLLVIVLSTGFVIIVNNYVNREVDTGEVSSFVFASSLLEENCFGKENELGVIDLNKFNEAKLNGCLKYNSEYLSASVKINNTELKMNNFDAKKTLCWQEKYSCILQSLYVLIDDNGEQKPETMYIEVITLE